MQMQQQQQVGGFGYDAATRDYPTEAELAQIINQQVPPVDTTQHVEKIHNVVSRCLPDVEQQVAQRSQCCSSKLACCNHPIVHKETGIEYRHIMRQLARKMRSLTRRIEYRRYEASQFRSNRNQVRRSFDRLTSLLEQ